MKELIASVRNGDVKAFEELYNNYSNYALRVATAVTKSKYLGGDAVQETFIRVYENINKFDINRPFEPWFYRILINECNRILKKRSKTVFLLDFKEKNLESAYNDTPKSVEYADLYSAIQNLKDEVRIPLILKYLKEFTEKEISDITGLNVNTVKTRLYKGRQQLKKEMEKLNEGSFKYDGKTR